MTRTKISAIVLGTITAFLLVAVMDTNSTYAQELEKKKTDTMKNERPSGYNIIFEIDPATETTVTIHSNNADDFKKAAINQLKQLNKSGVEIEDSVDKMIKQGISAYESLAKRGPVPNGVELYQSDFKIVSADGPICQTCGGEICWWP